MKQLNQKRKKDEQIESVPGIGLRAFQPVGNHWAWEYLAFLSTNGKYAVVIDLIERAGIKRRAVEWKH